MRLRNAYCCDTTFEYEIGEASKSTIYGSIDDKPSCASDPDPYCTFDRIRVLKLSDKEEEALQELINMTELSEEKILTQALRLYQLYRNGKLDKNISGGCMGDDV